ncbi:hypothetical protein, partial [Aeromonas veronii]|uniref:hypothetical protein n=1 Tax=Aeromonas veronii TaxID=654 RepID=UPI003D25DD74
TMMEYRQQKPRIGLTKCPDLVDHYTASLAASGAGNRSRTYDLRITNPDCGIFTLSNATPRNRIKPIKISMLIMYQCALLYRQYSPYIM